MQDTKRNLAFAATAVLAAASLCACTSVTADPASELPRDADMVLASASERGVGTVYANAAVWPDRIEELPARDLENSYFDNGGYASIAEMDPRAKSYACYAVRGTSPSFSMEALAEDRFDEAREARDMMADRALVSDALSRLDAGELGKPGWGSRTEVVIVRVCGYADYATVEVSPGPYEGAYDPNVSYASDLVYLDGAYVGHCELYTLEDRESFVADSVIRVYIEQNFPDEQEASGSSPRQHATGQA